MDLLKKISVIVPIYNKESRLDICIESLLQQTYNNLEIILINDGSIDRSSEIINFYYQKHPNIIRVINQENQGVASARNKGLIEATGDYIMFLDADDYLHTCSIEKVLQDAEESNADITRFKAIYKYSDGTEIIEKDDFPHMLLINKKDFKIYIYEKMIMGMKMNAIWKTLYKKSVINGILFREDMITAEDLVFNIDVFSKANSFMYLPYPYYYYYQSNEGLTGRGITVFRKYRCNFKVSIILLKHLKQWEMFSLSNIVKSFLRLFYLTFSKIKRRYLKDV